MNQIFERLIAMKKICGHILLENIPSEDKDKNKMVISKPGKIISNDNLSLNFQTSDRSEASEIR